jgi:RNA polymerase sigma-70 factor (ECF subfamily)
MRGIYDTIVTSLYQKSQSLAKDSISQNPFCVVTIDRTMHTKTLIDFDSLVDEHSREIFAYLWRMLRDPQDAEDALQETFLRAFRGFSRLENDSNLRAWLYKIATNVAYTLLKKRNRRASRTADLNEFTPIATSDNLARRDLLEAVLQAVEQLPPKQQAALILRNFQGFSYQEIGGTLDCSPEAARANVYQALKKLRSEFAAEGNK